MEVLIIGGGMVGATLAAVLAANGLSVAVVDASDADIPQPNAPPALRVSAISAASEQLLRVAGAWESLRASGICPYRRMAVWEGEDDGGALFDSESLGFESLGHIAENHKIRFAAVQALRERGAKWWCPAVVERLSPAPGDGWRVALDDGRQVHATLVIGADGARSRVRELAGIAWRRRAYDQHALIATVQTACGQQDITWQRFTPEGPQALLPLPGAWASLVWYHSPEEVERLLSLPEADFLAELQASFPERLGEIAALHQRGSFPLAIAHAEQYVMPGLALVGDAAHTVHPLAGQGVNLGLLDAAALCDALLSARRSRRPIGGEAVLAGYQRRRRAHNSVMLGAMDAIQRGFGVEWPGMPLLRQGLLGAAEHSGPIKDWVTRLAMGKAGDLPALVRAAPT